MRLLIALLLLCPLTVAAQQAEIDAPAPPRPADTSTSSTASQSSAGELPGTAPEYALVDLLGGKDQILVIQTRFIDTLLRTNPELQDYQPAVQAWAQQYIQWQEVRERLAAMYRNNFSAEELEAIVKFYRSPAGRKSALLMPTLVREGSQIGIDLAEAHRPELIDMLQAARERKAAANSSAASPAASAAGQ